MKALTIKEKLAGDYLTLATCWRLTLKDGTVLGFTNADQPLNINKITYVANTGFTPSAISSSNSFAIDNLEIDGMLDSEFITAEDIRAGRFDHAEISIFLVDYLHPESDHLILRTGWLGEIKFTDQHFITEVRGLMQAFSKKIGELYSPSCRTNFCDERCKLKASDYTFPGKVMAVLSPSEILCFPLDKKNGYFNYGKIKFLSGKNLGIEIEVKTYINDKIEFVLPLVKNISINDTFEIMAGCDKTFSTCINKFNNAINFRGEPHVPQMQKLLNNFS